MTSEQHFLDCIPDPLNRHTSYVCESSAQAEMLAKVAEDNRPDIYAVAGFETIAGVRRPAVSLSPKVMPVE